MKPAYIAAEIAGDSLRSVVLKIAEQANKVAIREGDHGIQFEPLDEAQPGAKEGGR